MSTTNRWRTSRSTFGARPGEVGWLAAAVLFLGSFAAVDAAPSATEGSSPRENRTASEAVIRVAAAPPGLADRSMDAFWIVAAALFGVALLGGLAGFLSLQYRRKAALRESEERMRTLVDFAPEAIVIIDARTGRFVDVNPNAVRLFGLERDSLLRGGPIDLSPAVQAGGRSSRAFMEEKIREALTGGTPVFEWTCRTSAGKTVPSEVHLVRLPGSGAEHIRGSIVDISERKRIDQMKNEFISTVSHELRTPITSIRGSLGLIAAGVAGPLPPSARAMVEIAHKNCERLVRLVNDILDMEKMEAGKVTFNVKPTRLMDVIERAVDLNRPFAEGRSVALRFSQRTPDEAVVFGDEDRLIQVLTNLISNAVKVSPRGEVVTLSVERRGNRFRTSIQDRGPGVPEEFRPRIFQKFAQADRRDDSTTRKGTGLGLTIAKSLVEKMGGNIGFETETGRGTCFYFDLLEDTRPRSPSQAAEAGVPLAPEAGYPVAQALKT